MEYIKKDKLKIGPGQYFKSTEKNNIIKRKRPPFHISTSRDYYYKIKDTPGPGSYDLIDNKSYNNKSYNNKDSTYISTNNNKNNNISSIMFNSSYLSKNTRNKKKNSIYVISEGDNTEKYITINNNKLPNLPKEENNKNKINYKNKSKRIKNHLKIELGSLQRTISIPSKDMNGYEYNLNKTLNLLIDKTNTKEYMGPGKYDVNLVQKPKSILEWSKTLNIIEIKKRKEEKTKNETIEKLKQSGDIIAKTKFTKNKKLQQFLKLKSQRILGNQKKGLNVLNMKLFTNKINKKPKIFLCSRDSFILDKKDIPGPGYYTKDLIKEKNEKNKDEINVYEGGFGSGCNRFIYKNNSMQDLGPTTYFIEKSKYEKQKKPDIFSHLKNKRLIDDKIVIKKKENKMPGPGSYDLSHSFINKSFCKGELMSYNKNRFKSEIKQNPGPGSYIFIDDINNNKNKIMKKIINSTFDVEEQRKKKKLELIKKENNKVPDVGTYNLEEFDSISNNIKMKFNRKLSYNSPFLMSSGRFLYKNNKIDLPIYNSKYIKKNSNYIVFSKSKRFKNNNSEYLTGPGCYELINNNQWNKKTFNKLFSSS